MASEGEEGPVGYGRPPNGRRFEKGRSGNPKGRPRKARTMGAAVDKVLDEKVEIRENGRRKRITKREASAKQLVNAGAAGDLRAIKLASDMAKAQADGGVDADAPLTVPEQEVFERFVARLREGLSSTDG